MISEDYDHRWEALAEVHFNAEDDFSDENYIYCLCSRVFIRDGVKLYMVEKEEGSESEVEVLRENNVQESDDHSHVHFSIDTSYKVKCEKDEGASCYCSASHTDNYCSTDEHDPAQGQTSILNALQPSDSGADLTYQESHLDYTNQDKLEKMDQDYPGQSATEFDENYLSESTWDKFWSVNGERIIWASWIKQYSDYINPAYLDENNDLIMEENIPRDNSVDQISHIKNTSKKEEDDDGIRERKFSYDSKVNPYKKGRINSESSAEKTNKSNEVLSNRDQAWLPIGGRRRSCSEHDRILSPRTLLGTDSMTNVTKITLSSYDVSSSHVTPVSTPTDEYSVSSSTSDDPSNDQTRIANLEENLETQTEEMDMDQSWQFLWKKHFGEQYALHYASYLECQNNAANKDAYINTELTEILKDKIEIDYENSDGNSQEMPTVIEVQNQVNKIKQEEKPRPKKRNKKSSTKYLGSVGVLLQNLLKEEQKNTSLEDVLEAGDESSEQKDTPPVDTVDGPKSENTNVEQAVNYDNYYNGSYEDDEDDRPPEDRPVTLKRSHEIDADELASEKIKSTFEQMGLCLDPDIILRGQLVYRKRLLRPPKSRNKKFGVPRKTYFDDDGNACVDQPQDSNEEKEMQTDDDEVSSDNTRQTNKPQRMATESETNKPAGFHDDRDASQAMATENVSSKSAGYHNNLDALLNNPTLCHGNDEEIPPQGMFTECATNVPPKPEGCEDEREVVDEAATVPLPSDVDSDGLGIDGLEKSGEEVLENVDAAPGEATKRRRRKRRRSPGDGALEMPAELQLHPNMKKYWKKRHSLFHRFDEGIKLDVESWFSVTPEKVARHIAEKCRCDLIVDAFCGAGGNAIQFAWTCERVIAIDIDPAKISLARHNAAVYGVADRIEFLVGDFFTLAPRLRADVVFLSPPWGGPSYVENSQYDLESMLEPKPASELMEAAQAISNNVAIYLPRNSRSEQLVSLAKYSGAVEIEQNFLGRRFIALTAYYGELVNY